MHSDRERERERIPLCPRYSGELCPLIDSNKSRQIEERRKTREISKTKSAMKLWSFGNKTSQKKLRICRLGIKSHNWKFLLDLSFLCILTFRKFNVNYEIEKFCKTPTLHDYYYCAMIRVFKFANSSEFSLPQQVMRHKVYEHRLWNINQSEFRFRGSSWRVKGWNAK